MNKLTITKKVFVPIKVTEESVKDIYGVIGTIAVKEETNKYVISKEELEEVISDAVEMARESIVIHKISEWETEKEFGYTEEQIINSII